MIQEILSTGKYNAMTGQYIGDLLGLSLRELVAAVEKERRAGAPICASNAEPYGYYLAADKEEMTSYCRTLQKRAGEIHKTRRACLKTVDKLPDPVEA